MSESLDLQLCEAMGSRNRAAIERLIFLGANINGIIGEHEPDNDGEIQTVFTELFFGFEDEEPFIFVDWLISQGASLIVPNNLNVMPLYFPVYGLNYFLVKGMLERGANPNNWCLNVFGYHTALDVLDGRSMTWLKDEEMDEVSRIESLLLSFGGKRYYDLVPDESGEV